MLKPENENTSTMHMQALITEWK
uniref:Uncharacterized protein n=1 Tax=Anguilla anguilla TaxID=7936 RepID=A0A0E9T1H6_ANGAN